MNVHKENDMIHIIIKNPEEEILTYLVRIDGSLEPHITCDTRGKVYKSMDNFYIHSGAEEYITYNTIAPDGRVIEVNRFLALHKNPGIQRVNGTRG